MITKEDMDQLYAVIGDLVKRQRLADLVERGREHRLKLEDAKEAIECLEFAVRLDLKIDPAIYKRLATKANRRKDEPLDIEALVDEVLNDIEKQRKF